MLRLNDAIKQRVGAIPMKHLFTTLQHVVELIKDGVYDFHTLPKKMKRKMKKEVKNQIEHIPVKFHQGTLISYVVVLNLKYRISR